MRGLADQRPIADSSPANLSAVVASQWEISEVDAELPVVTSTHDHAPGTTGCSKMGEEGDEHQKLIERIDEQRKHIDNLLHFLCECRTTAWQERVFLEWRNVSLESALIERTRLLHGAELEELTGDAGMQREGERLTVVVEEDSALALQVRAFL